MIPSLMLPHLVPPGGGRHFLHTISPGGCPKRNRKGMRRQRRLLSSRRVPNVVRSRNPGACKRAAYCTAGGGVWRQRSWSPKPEPVGKQVAPALTSLPFPHPLGSRCQGPQPVGRGRIPAESRGSCIRERRRPRGPGYSVAVFAHPRAEEPMRPEQG